MASSSADAHWPLVFQGAVVLILVTGGVWGLISAPLSKDFATVDRRIDRIDGGLSEIREAMKKETERVNRVFDDRRVEFVTQVEFRAEARRLDALLLALNKVDDARTIELSRIREEFASARRDAATRIDLQQALNTTRVEFIAEIRRLDSIASGALSQAAFDAWKQERDITIARLNNAVDLKSVAMPRDDVLLIQRQLEALERRMNIPRLQP